MNKRGLSKLAKFLIVFIIIFIILIAIFFTIFFINAKDNSSKSGTVPVNPVSNLTNEEAILKFDKSFVFYLLYSIKAYDLHNPPLSSDKPKIEIIISNQVFNAVIDEGRILISEDSISEKDIIIRTTKEESVKMIRDRKYIEDSFKSEKSSIELVSGKVTLAAKGYLGLYTEITGKSII
ncbi:MAG: hypothetical protein AABW81_00855 [Nanoarchaeota archaeon]